MMRLWVSNLPRKPKNKVSDEPKQNLTQGLVNRKPVEAPK